MNAKPDGHSWPQFSHERVESVTQARSAPAAGPRETGDWDPLREQHLALWARMDADQKLRDRPTQHYLGLQLEQAQAVAASENRTLEVLPEDSRIRRGEPGRERPPRVQVVLSSGRVVYAYGL